MFLKLSGNLTIGQFVEANASCVHAHSFIEHIHTLTVPKGL